MTTKTLKLDISQFRDKKSSSMDEMRGIRKNHPVKELKSSLEYLEKKHNPNGVDRVKDSDSYLTLVKKALDYPSWVFNSKQLHVVNKDPIYEITYTTHSEPKEYFMGMYIGKTTGNIYFSNTGEDIVFGTMLEHTRIKNVVNLIKGIQTFKLTGDFEDLNKYMFLKYEIEQNKTASTETSYIEIFNRSNTSSVKTQNNIQFPEYNYYDLAEYLQSFTQVLVNWRVIIQSIKVLSLMLSHGVGRISSVSPDTEEIITDFNKTIISTRINDLDWLVTNVKSSRNGIKNNILMMSTEYLSIDAEDRMNHIVEKIPESELLAYTFKSLVDNTDNELITLYSKETSIKIAKKLELSQSYVGTLESNVRLLDKRGYINIFKTDTNKFMSSGITLGASDLMFQSSKIGYKYIQRLHSILERLA